MRSRSKFQVFRCPRTSPAAGRDSPADCSTTINNNSKEMKLGEEEGGLSPKTAAGTDSPGKVRTQSQTGQLAQGWQELVTEKGQTLF